MSDLIDRQAAIDAIHEEWDYCINYDGSGHCIADETESAICRVPSSAQPEIIRCKDCKFARLTKNNEVKYCDIWFPDEMNYIDADNFCSMAERKEDARH